MNFSVLVAACIASTTILSAPAMASTMNLIENGSFEDNQISENWRVFQGTDVDGWAVLAGAGVEIQTNAVRSVIDTPFGNQYVELDSHNGNGGLTTGPTNSTIGQSVSLDAGAYNFSFWYTPRTDRANDNGIAYQLNTSMPLRSSVAVLAGLVDGSSAFPLGTWTKVTERFTVFDDGTTFNLLFSATGNDNSYGGLLDNVSISAVPLPASSLLLLAGLGGLGAMRRRRTT